jgi:hypothetical protein
MTSNELEKLLHLVHSVESMVMHGLANPKFKNRGSLFRTDQVSLLHSTHIALGTPVSYPLVTEFLSPGMNKLEYVYDHSPPSRARIKNVQSYTCTTLYIRNIIFK